MFSLDEYRALHESVGYAVRADRGRLRLRGPDRLSYLHGLLTNDITALTPGSGCYASLLTAQGRMIADMQVHELGDATLIDLDRTLTRQIHDHLDRFVITEDVTIEDVTDSLAQVGVYGPSTGEAVAAASSLIAASWPSPDTGLRGVETIVPADRVQELERLLRDAGATRVDLHTIDATRIEAGIPKFLVDMDTSTIPLEAGIEDRAISMTKGCYVGQEVIVRVLHRGGGRVAKKLVGLRAAGPLTSGDTLWSGEREVGKVTSAVESPRFGAIALGYVQRDFVEDGTPLVAKSNGTEVTVSVSAVPFDRSVSRPT